MPATIQGIVFNDLNGNGTFDPGEPGIPNAVVVLQDPNGVCTSILTNATGAYSFSGLTIPGTYTIYETVQDPGGICPPTTFTQPSGFNTSSTPRVDSLTVSQIQITNNQVLNGPNFGHQNLEVWTCDTAALQVAGSPSDMFSIDLVTGVSTPLGAITPSGQYNAIGFNVLDNTIWGYNQSTGKVIRINPDLTATSFNIPNLNAALFNVGDVDLNGYLYITQQATSRFYVVDVNSNSPTYLQLVDPTLGFIIDTAPRILIFKPYLKLSFSLS
ncbi:SdrD B-like domain-containing protein [Bacillus cereus]